MLASDMVLVAHPHGYPQAVHIFCGHRLHGGQRPRSLWLLPAWSFMVMTMKEKWEKAVLFLVSAFMP